MPYRLVVTPLAGPAAPHENDPRATTTGRAPATPADAHAAHTEHTLDLVREVVLVGRRPGVDVLLPDPRVGGVHLRLERRDGSVWAIDAGASSRTLRGDRPLPPGTPVPLVHGDELIVAGVFRLRFLAESPPGVVPAGPRRTDELARALARSAASSPGRAARGDAPALIVLAGADIGRRIPLPQPGGELVVGRGESCDVMIVHPDLSREHARVRVRWQGVTITDLGSKNGVFVRGERLPAGEERSLLDGDELVLGAVTLRLRDPTDDVLGELTAPHREAPPPPRAGFPRWSRSTVLAAAVLVAGAATLLALLLGA